MSQWPATKARRVLAALLRIGWSVKRQAVGRTASWLARAGRTVRQFDIEGKREKKDK
jgi:hypothetical protein